MALEKRWAAIAPIAFTVDGTSDGIVTLSTTKRIHVKQRIYIQATGNLNLFLEVKRVLSKTQLIVGPQGTPISTTTDISTYTTALGANLYALEQPRPAIPLQEIERAVFEEEPTVAIRSLLVDDLGNTFDEGNPLPVTATVTDSAPQNPYIYRIAYPTAGVEMTKAIPDNTKKLYVSAVGKMGVVRIAFSAGATITGPGESYVTVDMGNAYEREGIKLVGKTLYFQCSRGSVIIEIEVWV